jgi:arylsulfatase A-like enzyme
VAVEYYARRLGQPPSPLRIWRTPEWKYAEMPAGGEELYDLRTDPLEVHNLIDDPAAAGARRAMREALYAWLAQTGDTWPEIQVPEDATA